MKIDEEVLDSFEKVLLDVWESQEGIINQKSSKHQQRQIELDKKIDSLKTRLTETNNSTLISVYEEELVKSIEEFETVNLLCQEEESRQINLPALISNTRTVI